MPSNPKLTEKKRTVLITGANRGIGFHLTKKFLDLGDGVVAACRHPDKAADLTKLMDRFPDTLSVLKWDVAREGDARHALATLEGKLSHLDFLINNAGILEDYSTPFVETNLASVRDVFDTNLVGAMRVTQVLLPLLRKSPDPRVINVSSKVGSIADNTSGRGYAYRISKTAMNMFTKSLAIDEPSLTVVSVHPGWVKTDMGGPQAPTSPEESTAGLVKVILGLTKRDSGRFLDFRGETIPW